MLAATELSDEFASIITVSPVLISLTLPLEPSTVTVVELLMVKVLLVEVLELLF